MTRRACTAAELIAALALAVLVASGAWGIWRAVARGQDAPEALAARAGLRALAAVLAADVLQIGVAADQAEPLTAEGSTLEFRVCRFDGPAIRLAPVRYTFARGHLYRAAGGARPALAGAQRLTGCRFARIADARSGNVFLLVHLIAGRAEVSEMFPVPLPPARGNPAMSACAAIGD